MKARQCLMYSALIMMAAFGMSSCVMTCDRPISGDQIVELRKHRGFERIEISGSPNVVYTQADTFGVRLEGPEKMVENMMTEVKDRTLFVYNKGRVNLKVGFVNLNWGDKDDVTVYVSSPDLIGVRVSGSGDFVSRELIDTDNMEFVLRGSGDIDVQDVVCDRCRVEVVGSGDLDVKNLESRNVSVTLVGSGDIDLNLHRVNDTNIGLRGSGDINVNFNNDCGSVDCQLNGSGDINLSGRVSRFHMEKHGSGDIDIDNLSIEK